MNKYLWNIYTSMKNAQLTKKKFIYCENEKNSKIILKLFWDYGLIMGFKICSHNKKKLKIFLKYENQQPSIKKLKFISRPAWWISYSINQIYKIKKSFIIFSTNSGLQTIENCKKLKIGGEPIILIE